MNQEFLEELAAVEQTVAAATETEHASLGEFIRHEATARTGSPLAGVILCAGLPAEDSPAARSARIHLAAAMVLLDVALALHKLLLLQPADADTLDKSLVGGTVLAGDYCFSQAAVAAARTGVPRVVAIFSELLMEVSETNLRHLFGEESAAPNEASSLYYSSGLAGAVLAGLDESAQQSTALFAAGLAAPHGSTAPDGDTVRQAASLLDGSVPAHQRGRWRLLLDRIAQRN